MKKLFTLLLCLLSISGVQTIKAADEIYAVLSSDKQTMTLYYDEQRVSRGGVTDWKYISGETWIGLNVTKVILDVSMKNARPTSTKEWFFLFGKLETIEHLDYLNTSNVTDMRNMFAYCEKLTSLDVSNFNTSNVTDMRWMFDGCEKLTSLDISKFNTSNVTKMECMFCSCKKLTSLDISKWNTSNVTDMSFMFQQCYELKVLKLGNLNTSNVTNMSFMFQQCYELKELNLGNLNTSNVTDMTSMFDGCEKLTSLDVSNFNTSNVTSMSSMFDGCKALTSLDLSNFKTFKVETMSYMFYGCNRLQTLNLTSFTSQSLEWVKKIFYGCTNLKTIACLDDWSFLKEEIRTYNGEGEYYSLYNDSLFAFCNQLVGGNGTAYDSEKISLKYAHVDKYGQPGYFSSKIEVLPKIYGVLASDGKTLTLYYDDQYITRGGKKDWSTEYYANTTKVILDESMKEARPDNLEYWFADFNKLTEIEHLDYLNTSEATSMNSMFLNCYALTALDMSKFNTKKVESMASMFGACTALKELNVNNLDVQKVTDMWGMFNGCTALKTIECNNDWSKQLPPDCDSEEMFEECTSLVGGNKTAYSSDHTDASYARPDEDGNPGYFTMIKTAIKNVQRDKAQGTKVLRDGILLIERNGKTYNAQGAEVK